VNVIERVSVEGRKRELASCGGGVLLQRGACGMAGNAAKGGKVAREWE
jgi:hypothetical protein